MEPIIRVEGLGKRYRIGVPEPPPENWQAGLRSILLSPFQYLRQVSRPATEADRH